MRDGALRRIIPALHPAWSKPILTQRIEPNLQNNKNAIGKSTSQDAFETPLISPEIAVFEKIVPLLANGIVTRSGWRWCLVVD
jgi:hypothetical protein